MRDSKSGKRGEGSKIRSQIGGQEAGERDTA